MYSGPGEVAVPQLETRELTELKVVIFMILSN